MKGGDKVIKNTPSYEILANDDYAQAFQFTPVDMVDPDQAEEKVVSDYIAKVMYQAYLKEGQQKFDFKKVLTKRAYRQASKARKLKSISDEGNQV